MKRNGIIALVLFMALLFVTVVEIVLNLQLSTGTYTIEQLTRAIALLGLLGIFSKILIISLFGVIILELGLFSD